MLYNNRVLRGHLNQSLSDACSTRKHAKRNSVLTLLDMETFNVGVATPQPTTSARESGSQKCRKVCFVNSGARRGLAFSKVVYIRVRILRV